MTDTGKPESRPKAAPAGKVLPQLVAAVRQEQQRLAQIAAQLAEGIAEAEEHAQLRRDYTALASRCETAETALVRATEALSRRDFSSEVPGWEDLPPETRATVLLDKLEEARANHAASEVRLVDTQSRLEDRVGELEAEVRALHERLHETAAERDDWKRQNGEAEARIRQLEGEVRTLNQGLEQNERQRQELSAALEKATLSRDEWKAKAEAAEAATRDLMKQHNVMLLAKDFDFTRQKQEMQQEYMRQLQEMQGAHLRHLRQMEAMMDLAKGEMAARKSLRAEPPPLPAEPVEAPAASPLRSLIEESERLVNLNQSETWEVLNSRMGEYLEIAQERGLTEADKWLQSEARKKAERRPA